MPYKDPEVRRRQQRKYAKSYYAKNREQVIQKSKLSRRAMVRRYYEYKKNLSCISCGFTHHVALDFHHVEKKPSNVTVTNLVRDGHSWERIIKEIAKCVVLCANCHRVHHFEERQLIRALRKAQKKKPVRETG